MEAYLCALKKEIKRWGGSFSRPIDSIYLGGGTPSLLNGEIVSLLDCVYDSFDVLPGAEITAEINPSGEPENFLIPAFGAGVNRLSVGVQSGNDSVLRTLGRRHTASDARKTVEKARKIGFNNISVDIIIGLPGENTADMLKSLDFALSLEPEHISAYMLIIEPKTKLYFEGISGADSENTAQQYLALCDKLSEAGFRHYEISNFALPGFESRHNLKYWRYREYLGIGPSAHSFISGKRFYYPEDLRGFIRSPKTVPESDGTDESERIMLALRLDSGYDFAPFPQLAGYLEALSREGYGKISGSVFSLTERGMLVSNQIITEILERIL